MSTYVDLLFNRFHTKGIILDANLLLLYVIGRYDERLIGDGKYNKLSKYTTEDYRLLGKLLQVFRASATTPHVLTELSNLTGDLPEATRISCWATYSSIFQDYEEVQIPCMTAFARKEFNLLGMADAVLAEICERFLVVTDDAKLVNKLNQSGLEALNFNHLRDYLFR